MEVHIRQELSTIAHIHKFLTKEMDGSTAEAYKSLVEAYTTWFEGKNSSWTHLKPGLIVPAFSEHVALLHEHKLRSEHRPVPRSLVQNLW